MITPTTTAAGWGPSLARGGPAHVHHHHHYHHHHHFPLPPDQLTILLYLYARLTCLNRIAARHGELI
jgi:hypothetical protein